MACYVYIPFRDLSQDSVTAETAADLRALGLDAIQIDDLSVVGSDDLLMIGGHGSWAVNKIFSETTGGSMLESITANDLAAKLKTARLGKQHGPVLMLTCYGGGTSSFKLPSTLDTSLAHDVGAADLDVVTNPKGKTCFASLLAKALGQNGFYSILVGGWPGGWARDVENKVSVFTVGEHYVNTQLDHVQWFDARGLTTARSGVTMATPAKLNRTG